MSHNSSTTSQDTTLTTPDQSPGADGDIWADDSPSDIPDGNPPRNQEMLSDLPSIRRQHMTDGYREGLSVGKARVIQPGFDAGYPIGVEIALRAGKVLGVLEGYLAVKGDALDAKTRGEVKKMYEQAKMQLDVKELLGGVDDKVISEAKAIEGLGRVEATLRRWEELVLQQSAHG